MMFLAHETKITVGKSKEMVFRGRSLGNPTLYGEFPQEMSR